MAPQVRQVLSALDRFQSYKPLAYAPAHGPIVRYAQRELMTAYRQWSQAQQQQSLTTVLLYASAYGSTGTLAQAIAQGIVKSGVRVDIINCEMATTEEIRTAVERCEGVIVGSPTLGGHAPTPIQTALGIVLSTLPKDKLTGVFGSFGWSGEAVDLLEGKLKDAGFRFGFEPIRVKFKPNESTLQNCEEAGTDFAQALKRFTKKSLVAKQPATNVEQAVGRIIGSLCVVTATQGEIKTGMLASWVTQASFNPPGLTIAVAKDRAMENLTHTSNPFIVNILFIS